MTMGQDRGFIEGGSAAGRWELVMTGEPTLSAFT